MEHKKIPIQQKKIKEGIEEENRYKIQKTNSKMAEVFPYQ